MTEVRSLFGPRLVDFAVAGVQKGGTTALAAYLREHPEVCLHVRKEVHFFDTDRHFGAEPVDYAPYHDFFEPAPTHRLLGDVTPIYVFWPTAPERMARYNPAMKIIVLLREPIARAFSQWNMSRQAGRESLGFMEAVRLEPERARTVPAEEAFRWLAYVERGRYAGQLRRLWRHFPKEQTLILRSESLRRTPDAALTQIASFLGLAPFTSTASKVVHAREYQDTLTDEAVDYLRGVFTPELDDLERLLGWDLSDWRR